MELLESVGPRPRQARYQAALRPDMKCVINLKHFPTLPLVGSNFNIRLCTNSVQMGLLHVTVHSVRG